MKIAQYAVVCCVAVASQGCALFKAATSGNLAAAAAETERIAKESAAAAKRAEQQCAPIKEKVVGFEEERAIGGAIGVNLVSSSGTLVLEGMTEKDPEALNKKLSDKPGSVTLPDNAVNDMTAYITVVGKNLARYSARPDLPWTFAVIENEAVNAFSAPGGYVAISTGLLKKLTNEAQLAGVLGHEIAHVVHKHSLKKYQAAKETQCVIANTGANLIEAGLPANPPFDKASKFARKFDGQVDLDKEEGGFIMFVMEGVIKLIQAGNDKDSEFQADATALELVAFAGYDPTEYEKFLVSLGNQGGFFSLSHPATSDRVERLKGLREGDLSPFATGTAKPDTSKVFAPITPKS